MFKWESWPRECPLVIQSGEGGQTNLAYGKSLPPSYLASKFEVGWPRDATSTANIHAARTHTRTRFRFAHGLTYRDPWTSCRIAESSRSWTAALRTWWRGFLALIFAEQVRGSFACNKFPVGGRPRKWPLSDLDSRERPPTERETEGKNGAQLTPRDRAAICPWLRTFFPRPPARGCKLHVHVTLQAGASLLNAD